MLGETQKYSFLCRLWIKGRKLVGPLLRHSDHFLVGGEKVQMGF